MAILRERATKIFISAGEASGDLHGSSLARAILNQNHRAHITCLGGPLLEQAGAAMVVDNRDLAVVGLAELVHHIRAIHKAWRKLKEHLLNDRPDIIVLIDFPEFNFMIARLAKKLGIKIFYYISPQVWAWRKGRVRTLRRLVSQMAVILPFEPPFYERYGMEVTYVGHPLLDALSTPPPREESRNKYKPEPTKFLIGLLPGSRSSEIRSLLPILLESAAILKSEIPELSFIMPVASSLDPALIQEEASKSKVPVQLITGDTYRVIRACDLIITASGTVTLEAAILETPMIIIYKVSHLTYLVGRQLVKGVDHMGLPNLIAGRRIIPELLQDEAEPYRISAEALSLLKNPHLLSSQRRQLALIREKLGSPGVANRVARMVLSECAG